MDFDTASNRLPLVSLWLKGEAPTMHDIIATLSEDSPYRASTPSFYNIVPVFPQVTLSSGWGIQCLHPLRGLIVEVWALSTDYVLSGLHPRFNNAVAHFVGYCRLAPHGASAA